MKTAKRKSVSVRKNKSHISLHQEIASFVIVALLLLPSVISIPSVSAQTTPATNAIANFYRAMGNEEYAGYWSDTGNLIQNAKERLNRMLQLVNLLGTIVGQRGIVAEPAPTSQGTFVDLDANGIDGPVFINAGGSLALSWRSAGVESCEGTSNKTATANWGGDNMAASGVKAIAGVTESTLFKLKCKVAGRSASVVDTVVVNVLGKDKVDDDEINEIDTELEADPDSLKTGSSTTLSWSANKADSCNASSVPTSDWAGAVATSGTKVISNLTANTTFTLSCKNEYDTDTDKVTVSVSATDDDDDADDADDDDDDDDDTSTTTPATTITVLNPDGGENWTTGESRMIRWTTNASESAKIRIRLVSADTDDENMIIDRGVPNTGKYEWTVGKYNFNSQTAPAGSKYKVAICVMKTDTTEGVCDRSNARFTIKAQPISLASQTDLAAAVGSLQSLLNGLSALIQAR